MGGIETQVHDLAARQVAAGHEVHVLTATAGADGVRRALRVLPSGVRVHRMASAVAFGLPVNPRGPWLIGEALRRVRPDVVHVHAGVVSPFAFDGARAARAASVPLALTWHCMLDGVEGPFGLAAGITGWQEAPAALSAVSGVAAQRVARVMGRPVADVGVVPNGLDVAAWAPAPDLPGPALPPAGPLRVVATQRLAPRKRVLPLIRLLGAVHERLGRDGIGAPRVHLSVIGGGPEDRSARAEVRRRGLGDVVEVVGRVPREHLPQRYAAAHVFLAPARLEAFGIAALEARAAGLPVVAGRGTGISEFIEHDVDGLLTADRADGLDDDAADAALADALVRLATEPGLVGGLRHRAHVGPPPADWSNVLRAADRLYARAQGALRHS
ncbi:glycosyltransferase family 4 protein [Georgenia sp. 10Sc9-8]|uniref:Glycosyltransferase family 4 protein n=1 Tax=Georgenia halotolerans TaxID=3028317 RepID=A0ABT5U0X9_9MICO|nr:glycosyltransferase family 4 protein [Georgenia halotolerans]